MIKKLLRKSAFLKKMSRLYRAKRQGHPDWKMLLGHDMQQWQEALIRSKNGPKILIATSLGSFVVGNIVESLVAVALTLRGANVSTYFCDTALPACQLCGNQWYPDQKSFAKNGPRKDLCIGCFSVAKSMYQTLDIPVLGYGEFLSDADQRSAEEIARELPINEIRSYKHEGIAVGDHAFAGTLRFYGKGILRDEPFSEAVLRRYFKASLLTMFSVRKLKKKQGVETAVFNHGIYVPQGIIGEVLRQEKVRVVNWNPAYKKQCFIFSHNDTYHHTLMSEPTAKWEDMDWNDQIEAELMSYLKSRWQGTNDWIWFHDKPSEDLNEITRELGIDFSKPCIGLLTNVMWDAQLHYPANAFPNMLAWVLKTIDYFAKRKDLQLIIRVHPAEIRGLVRSRQKMVDEIKKVYSKLPGNIFIIPPESQISTYAIMMRCNAAIIYGTKTGVELTSLGLPIIVAGEAWIRNKGFTHDAASIADYFKILDKLPFKQKMSPQDTARAKKYAFHFFFRRMIPLSYMQPTGAQPPFKIRLESGLADLMPGRNKGLDVICEGILDGKDFIYPAEKELVTGRA